jgi:hypothetical protein
MRSTASLHVLTPAKSSGAAGSKALPLPSRHARSIGRALNAAKFVVFKSVVSLAPAALLVSGVGAGVGNAALESRRDRRAVAVAVDVRKSNGGWYFVADTADVDVDDCGGGDTTSGLCVVVFGEATAVELVDVVCI